MRQNALLAVTSVANYDRDALNEIARILGSNSEAARIYRIGIENRALLTPDEIIQFDSLCYLSMNSMYLQFKRGASVTNDAEITFSQSGYRQYWDVYSRNFSEDFREEVAAQQGAAADTAQAE